MPHLAIDVALFDLVRRLALYFPGGAVPKLGLQAPSSLDLLREQPTFWQVELDLSVFLTWA